jgi:hypothetical protein
LCLCCPFFHVLSSSYYLGLIFSALVWIDLPRVELLGFVFSYIFLDWSFSCWKLLEISFHLLLSWEIHYSSHWGLLRNGGAKWYGEYERRDWYARFYLGSGPRPNPSTLDDYRSLQDCYHALGFARDRERSFVPYRAILVDAFVDVESCIFSCMPSRLATSWMLALLGQLALELSHFILYVSPPCRGAHK